MSTTSVVAELIVVGGGALAWLVLLIGSLFGRDVVEARLVSSPLGAAVGLASAYVLGIVVDRLADAVFNPFATRLRRTWFADHDEFQSARAGAFASPQREMFEYNRSRLRIARGCALNGPPVALLANVYIWSELTPMFPRARLAFVITVGVLAITSGCVYAWYDLCRNEAKNLRRLMTPGPLTLG